MTGHDLNAWRKRLGYTIPDAAKALGLSLGRFTDNLYVPDRPPSPHTAAKAKLIELERKANEHA
jgi:hypothetical protein